MSPETLRALSTSAEMFKMEIDLASSYRTTHGFEKLNDENYATWAFDVKYQFLKEKLWGPVSGTEVAPTPPAQSLNESEEDETAREA